MRDNASYHEAASDVWLENVVEGAVGEVAAVVGEDGRHVAQTLLVPTAAPDRHRGLRLGQLGLVLLCARGVEQAAHRQSSVVVGWIARVSDQPRVVLRLTDTQGDIPLDTFNIDKKTCCKLVSSRWKRKYFNVH